MSEKEIMNRLEFVLYMNNKDRYSVIMGEKPNITVDLHMLTCKEAKKLINQIIAICRFPFELSLIHGYNHGTALRTMVQSDFNENPRIKAITQQEHNEGLTIFSVEGC